ncbi:uncharacterized protein LOC131015493 isoform X2 [Salvia miltiorrhiza]|nr:uncharacterized protein LOC131015493 isoform X2 [Salvia miltiorrhiza]
MPKSSHLELHASDSEALDLLDSLSLPPEPPDIRNWFPSYVYESPELDDLDCFQDSDGAGDRCVKEDSTRKSGNSCPIGKYDDACAGQVKPSHGIESNVSAAMVSGLSDSSLSLPEEPPDIRNWFSSYVYESPLLDTALDFAISVCEESKDGKLGAVEKSACQNIKDPMASSSGEKSELCPLKNTSDAVVKGPNIVNG